MLQSLYGYLQGGRNETLKILFKKKKKTVDKLWSRESQLGELHTVVWMREAKQKEMGTEGKEWDHVGEWWTKIGGD